MQFAFKSCFLAFLALALPLSAQEPASPPKYVPKVVPVPPLPTMPRGGAPAETIVREPTSPPAQTVTDARTHVTFNLPPGWNVTKTDGELSTFRLDARTAPRSSSLRAVASLGFNPYPASTFSGALFYLSVAPVGKSACAAQARVRPLKPLPQATVADLKFSRGRDEHGKICTQARDVVYTATHAGACLRFDLAVNNFCGGEVSGARDLTETQLNALFSRLESILSTVRFQP